MQALLGLTVSDPLAMGEVWRLASWLLDVTAGLTRGGWGLGHVREGAPLVRRAKIHRPVALEAALALVRGLIVGWARGCPLSVWQGTRSWGPRARRRTVRATVVTDRVPPGAGGEDRQITQGGLVVTADGAWASLGE